MVVSLAAYMSYFAARYGLSFDQPGMDALWPVVWMLTSAALAIAHIPAWLLTRKIAVERTNTALRYVTSTALLYAVAIAGIAIQGSDWDELALFLIPTLPSIMVVTMLTAFSPQRDDRRGQSDTAGGR